MLVPASGWLGDRIGLRKIYLASLLLFGAASALCGLAWNLESMIVFGFCRRSRVGYCRWWY